MSQTPGDPDAASVSDAMSEGYDETVETVGRDDAEADAVRSGVDPEPDSYDYDLGPASLGLGGEAATSRDTDGEPVGAADADADAARTGGDR